MKRLKLYQELPRAPVDNDREPLDRSCKKCPWSLGEGQACLPADGRPGGLLVVGDAPVKGAVRPFASKSGAYVRTLVSRSWKGPVVFDYAVKCPAKGTKMKDAAKPIKECRPYLAEVIAQVKPERVLAVGSWATAGLLGRSLDMESARRGYGWILGDVPVFMLDNPIRAMQNKFYRRRYEDDFQWALTTKRPSPSHLDGLVHVIEDMDDALQAEEYLDQFDELLFDVETAGVPHAPDFTVLCAGLAPVDELEGDAWVWSDKALADEDARAALARLLARKKISGSNIKYDAIASEHCLDAPVGKVEFDTQLVRKLSEPMAKGRLEYAAELVGRGGAKEEAAVYRHEAVRAARRKNWRPGEKPHDHWCVQAIRNGAETNRYSFGLLPDDILWRYNGRDVVTSAAAVIHLRNRVQAEQPHEMKCWEELYRVALPSFKRIERTGIAADKQAFEMFAAHLKIGLDELRDKFKAYGPDFNPNTPKKVAYILFDKLKLPKYVAKINELTGDPSTDKETLAKLRGLHPFVDDMISWRTLQKMDSQYASGMIPHILADGRIHPSFRLDGTETGRISSENPNSQNLPRAETAEGKMCRDGFVAAKGKILIELDQSQIELRVAAGMSGDPDMIAIFKSGQDFHMATAKLVAKIAWGIVKDEDVTEWHRQYCKTINFGLLYGKTDAGLAAQLGCTTDEAAALRRAILGRFKKLAEMIKRLLYQVRSHGKVEVPWGDFWHERPLYEAGSPEKFKKMNAENASINTPIQGRAAWYTLASIPLIHEWIDANGYTGDVEIVNTVHDSIKIEAPPELVDTVIENGSRIMTSFDCWGVPLVADAKAGDRWGSLRKIKRGEKFVDAQVRWAAEALKATTL